MQRTHTRGHCTAVALYMMAKAATVASLTLGCGGHADRSDGQVDGSTCRNDSPPPGVQGVMGGSACTLPGGQPGIGLGSYGCVDPNACHCVDQAGSASCAQGWPDSPGINVHCVYAQCNSHNQDRACALSGGGEGLCCGTTCSNSVPNYLRPFPQGVVPNPSNCGGCGQTCPTGSTCDSNFRCTLDCQTQPCPTGMVCLAWSSGSRCMLATCLSQPDGVRCADDAGFSGMCCAGQCIDPISDNAHCSGCGMPCCSGTTCGSENGLGAPAVCLGPVR